VLDGKTRKVTLTCPRRTGGWRAEGLVLSADDAERVKKLTGVDEVLSNRAMKEDDLPQLKAAEVIYTLFSPAEGNAQSRGELRAANDAIKADYWDGRPSREENFAGLLRKRFPTASVKDLTPILDGMRAIKSKREVALIRRASQPPVVVDEAMKSTKPGGMNINSMPPRVTCSWSTARGWMVIVPSRLRARTTSTTCITTGTTRSCRPAIWC
jgi:Xaa-Pro aminopeptidase